MPKNTPPVDRSPDTGFFVPRYHRWAIEFIGSPLDGNRANFRGTPETGMTMLFRTRTKARDWLSAYKKENRWTFSGGYACQGRGNRIYKSIRVVPVEVSVERRQ